MGTASASGTTHTALLLANYMTGVLGKRVAYLEWNQQGTLERMEAVCTGGVSKNKPYQVFNVCYYKNAGMAELIACMNLDYQNIVIDFGSDYEAAKTEFLRCNKKIVVMALSEWQLGVCLEFLETVDLKQIKSWNYLTVFGSEETRMEIKKRWKIDVRRVPFSVDAFTVTRDVMMCFERICN